MRLQQFAIGKANGICIVVTKDWFIGTWQHRTMSLGNNIDVNEHAGYVKSSVRAP